MSKRVKWNVEPCKSENICNLFPANRILVMPNLNIKSINKSTINYAAKIRITYKSVKRRKNRPHIGIKR